MFVIQVHDACDVFLAADHLSNSNSNGFRWAIAKTPCRRLAHTRRCVHVKANRCSNRLLFFFFFFNLHYLICLSCFPFPAEPYLQPCSPLCGQPSLVFFFSQPVKEVWPRSGAAVCGFLLLPPKRSEVEHYEIKPPEKVVDGNDGSHGLIFLPAKIFEFGRVEESCLTNGLKVYE